jgi:hypothetical protein
MRRMLATAFLVCAVMLGVGLLSKTSRSYSHVLADDQQFPSLPPPSSPVRPLAPATEQGDPFQSRPPAPRIRPRLTSEIESLDAAPVVRPTSIEQRDRLGSEVREPTVVLNSRITMSVTPEHKIRAFAGGKVIAVEKSALDAGTILITAEEFELLPPNKLGGPPLIRCHGNVEIVSSQFKASGAKFSMDQDELFLEGTTERPAALSKYTVETSVVIAPSIIPIADPRFSTQDSVLTAEVPSTPANTPPAPSPEFSISSVRISFTRALDRLQVGHGITVTPALTGTPPAQEPLIAPVPVPIPPRSPARTPLTPYDEPNFLPPKAPKASDSPAPDSSEEKSSLPTPVPPVSQS